MYTFKITYIFIIYNLNTFFSYIYISVHSTLFNLWFFFLYWCYIASLLCYSYVCLYYHACLHYVNKKWSDKDTDCICCVYSILKWNWNHKNLSFPWIYDMNIMIIFFFFDDFTLSPLGVPPAVRWILKLATNLATLALVTWTQVDKWEKSSLTLHACSAHYL